MKQFYRLHKINHLLQKETQLFFLKKPSFEPILNLFGLFVLGCLKFIYYILSMLYLLYLLVLAAGNGQIEVLKWLIEQGANSKRKVLVLFQGCRRGNIGPFTTVTSNRKLCINACAQGTTGQISSNTTTIPVSRSGSINNVSVLYPL